MVLFGGCATLSDEDKPRDQVPFEAEFEREGFRMIWGSADDDVWAIGVELEEEGEGEGAGEPRSRHPVLICDPGPPAFVNIVRHFDGERWTRDQIVGPFLHDLHGSDRENVWAVGGDAIFRLDQGHWIAQDIASAIATQEGPGCGEVSLESVWALSPTDVWAVGFSPFETHSALILHFDGERWQRHPVDAIDTFFAVWASAPDDAWAVGASGNAYHYDGTSWQRSDARTQEYLFTVWGTGPSDVWTAGNAGVQARFDGARWTPHQAVVRQTIRSLVGRAPDDIWAIAQPLEGPDGRRAAMGLLRWDGERWEHDDVNDESIVDLWLSPSGKLWTAGERIAQR